MAGEGEGVLGVEARARALAGMAGMAAAWAGLFLFLRLGPFRRLSHDFSNRAVSFLHAVCAGAGAVWALEDWSVQSLGEPTSEKQVRARDRRAAPSTGLHPLQSFPSARSPPPRTPNSASTPGQPPARACRRRGGSLAY